MLTEQHNNSRQSYDGTTRLQIKLSRYDILNIAMIIALFIGDDYHGDQSL